MAPSELAKILEQARVMPELTGLLKPADAVFLVGGALRDLHLGRPIVDFDFALPGDPTVLAQAFARRLGGHWFMLDGQRRQSRVVAGRLSYDFAPFRAPDLEGDLRLRDFTVNALAVPLAPSGATGPLCDPLGGRADLEARILRACSAGVLADDPLRVLKGVRHAAVLGFSIAEETFALMRQSAAGIDRIAAERVRGELAAIFAAPSLPQSIDTLAQLGIWHYLLGAPAGSLATAGLLVARMEAVLAACATDPETAPLLGEEAEAGVSRAALLRLAAFLRGYQPAELPTAVASLRFGRRTAALLLALQALPAARLDEASRLPDYDRGRALWAARLGSSPVDHLLFLPVLAEEPPTSAWQRLRPVLLDYRRQARAGRIPDLVDGEWLRRHLGIGAGREAGALLAGLRREEIAGRVRSAAQAADFLRAQRAENSQQND